MSILVVYSSTAAEVFKSTNPNHSRVFVKQLLIVVTGLAGVYVTHLIPYKFYDKFEWIIYALAVLFTIAVYIFGEAPENSQDAVRWIMIPVINLTFQPSDFVKLATVIVLARELARRQSELHEGSIFPPFTKRGWRANRNSTDILKKRTLPLLLPIIISCALVLPTNLSTALILFATCVVLLFLGRIKLTDIGKLLLIVLVGALFAYGVMKVTGIEPERLATWEKRVMVFLGYADDDKDATLQIDQAKIAIATGEIFGMGAGKSIQRAMLPKAESDYAYAFIIEEYGLAGGIITLMLYLWIFYQATLIFRKCGTAFPTMLVLGLGLLITLQALTNMMVSTDLLPSTGLTLPLISKGGSSVLFMSLALGIMLGVSREIEVKPLEEMPMNKNNK
jgi:cell division protein FtsW